MDFAKTPVTFDDGQSSVVTFPEEIVQRGLFPPVRLDDGSIERGDVLPSGWLNDIVNQASVINPANYYDNNISDGTFSSAAGSQNVSWIRSDTCLLTWGGWRSNGGGASVQKVSITFPFPYKAGTKPVVVAWDPSGNLPGYFWVDYSTLTPTGVDLWWGHASSITDPLSFSYAVMGEWARGSAVPTSSITDYCIEPQTFVDGQTSFSSPSAEQISFGFRPPIEDSGVISVGDTVPANVLNYIFHDLFARRANGLQVKMTITGSTTATPKYSLVVGEMKIQMWRALVPAAGSTGTVMPFPQAFNRNETVVAFANCCFTTSAAMTANDYRYPGISISSAGLRCAAWGGTNLTTNVATEVDFMAIGEATAADKVPATNHYNSAVTALPGFATADRTYADGQKNKVSPSAAQIAGGFYPSRKNANGIVVPGDLVSANKLNWVINQLYQQDFSHGVKRIISDTFPQTPPATPAAGAMQGYIAIEGDDWVMYTGKMQINAGGFAQDSSTKFITIPYPIPFKSGTKPFLFMADEQTNNGMILYVDTTLGDNSSAKIAAAAANALSTLLTIPDASSAGWGVRFCLVGKKA